MLKVLDAEPFDDRVICHSERGRWPASWISHTRSFEHLPVVVAYRCRFSFDSARTVRVHVSADERYELFLDAVRIGRGPERGDRENWFFETYDLELAVGEHILVARTWWIGENGSSLYAQMTVKPGFLLAAQGDEGDLLSTGRGHWECKKLGGYEWISQPLVWGTGANLCIRGNKYDWGFEWGLGEGWKLANVIAEAGNASNANEWSPVWRLRPGMLPAIMESRINQGEPRHVEAVDSDDTVSLAVSEARHLDVEAADWKSLLTGELSLTIPANTMRRVILDLGNYYCAFPEVVLSGGEGSLIRLNWAESLYEGPEQESKGNRDEIEGKFFMGVGDTFYNDGGKDRFYETLWWQAGRYVEVLVSTADDSLEIESLAFRETHYPYHWDFGFETDDHQVNSVVPIALRALEMCSHETYMDCPYYEQLMYVGDARLETLTTYVTTRDDRLPRKAIFMFDKSRLNSGITQSRYPSRVTQVIPPFSLWWILMVHDYAMWRNDTGFVGGMMPGARAVLEAFRKWINADSLVEAPVGWNFVDWVPGWDWGMPPGAAYGVNATLNWQFVYVLNQAAELEDMLGEHHLASRNRELAAEVAEAAKIAFWNESKGIFAEDTNMRCFSEHAQCLAMLSGMLDNQTRDRVADGFVNNPQLERATIYFSHYVFETYRLIGRTDRLFERLRLWFDLERQGFKTTPECSEPSRSDCHAWGAHMLFHCFASILGIRPDKPGFSVVRIEPNLGPLTSVNACMPHPNGLIVIDLGVVDGQLAGIVELPPGTTGVFRGGGKTLAIGAGLNHI